MKKNLEIAFVGDVMPCGLSIPPQVDELKSQLWGPVEGADLVIVNLECPLTTHPTPHHGRSFNFSASSDCLRLFDQRFVLGLANNHMMDFGEQGLSDTLLALGKHGVCYAGAGTCLLDASRPAIVDIGSTRVAVLVAGDPRYDPAGDATPGILSADMDVLGPLVDELTSTADVIIASLHVGVEYSPYRTPFMRSLAEQLVTKGVDVVAFHHSHCLSGWNVQADGAIIWGLGNYVFTSAGEEWTRLWTDSAVWRVSVSLTGSTAPTVVPIPVTLDRNGLPRLATFRDRQRIVRKIAQQSRRQVNISCGPLACLVQSFSLAYIRLSLDGYIRMCKRWGLRYVLRCIARSCHSHFRSTDRPCGKKTHETGAE